MNIDHLSIVAIPCHKDNPRVISSNYIYRITPHQSKKAEPNDPAFVVIYLTVFCCLVFKFTPNSPNTNQINAEKLDDACNGKDRNPEAYLSYGMITQFPILYLI